MPIVYRGAGLASEGCFETYRKRYNGWIKDSGLCPPPWRCRMGSIVSLFFRPFVVRSSILEVQADACFPRCSLCPIISLS